MKESLPIPFDEAFLAEIRALLGPETAAFLDEMERPYAASLRLNPLRLNAETVSRPFTGEPVAWCPQGRYILPGTRPGLSPLQAAGAYYIQEASAMAPAMALSVRPGEKVLDLCAAPGGKSGQLAATLAGEGLLVANEPESSRAKLLASTLERLGVKNSIVTNALPEKLSPLLHEFFDAVLVDAPCSGEGMFRRDPATRAQWTPGAPAGCAARQVGILDHAAMMLRPGGRLAYSTCTFNRAENEGSIESFLARHPEFTPLPFELPGVGSAENGCLRLWPHRLRGEGHFVALLEKSAACPSPAKKAPERPRGKSSGKSAAAPEAGAIREALRLLHDIVPEVASLLPGGRTALINDTLYLLPAAAPELPGVHVLRSGLKLCRMGKGYVEPDHTLAMALAPSQAARSFDMTDEQAVSYLSGSTLSCADTLRGWTLMTLHSLPLGWAKASGGVLKNHLPKGLRQA